MADEKPTPRRAFKLTCNLQDDTRNDLVGLLRHIEFLLSTDQLSTGGTGGPNAGGTYALDIDESITNQSYFAAVDESLNRRAEPPHGR